MSSKKVVLVADDEPDNIEYVRHVLADEFEVVGVPDGDAALKEAGERQPAVILLDRQGRSSDLQRTAKRSGHENDPCHHVHRCDSPHRYCFLRRCRGGVCGGTARGLRRETYGP